MRCRKPIRLKNYDYSKPGYYFITICTIQRVHWFGCIQQGNMILNDVGRMVKRVWEELPQYYDGIDLDEFIVMPNHIHGIIVINPYDHGPAQRPARTIDVGDGHRVPNDGIAKNDVGDGPRAVPNNAMAKNDDVREGHRALPQIIHGYKSYTTALFRRSGYQPKLWHRSFYDHIIRNEQSLNHIRQYIQDNPFHWKSDEHFSS